MKRILFISLLLLSTVNFALAQKNTPKLNLRTRHTILANFLKAIRYRNVSSHLQIPGIRLLL